MSRKTKKEKVLAQYRRKIQQIEKVASMSSPTYQLPEKRHFAASQSLPQRDLVGNHSYVVNDLKRIAVLSVLAICAQVVLWLYLGKR